MRIVFALIGVTALTSAAAASTDIRKAVQAELKSTSQKVVSAARADLDRDGTLETIAITYKKIENGHPLGGEIIVLQNRKGRLTPIWRQKNLNPWKLRIADVDGDKQKEITAGVWKKSPKDPVMAKRVFVFNWNGQRITPKWLGSRLSRRFEDYEFRDLNKDGWDELLSLEISPNRPKRIGIYRWRSFGFDWLSSASPSKWKELTK